MNYGASGDVRSTLGNPTEEEISASDISLGRQKATAIVDSYLETQFPSVVPWTASGDVPILINSITDDIAVYYIKRDKHPGPMPLSDDIKEEYWDKSIALLEKIRGGKIQLPELTAETTDAIKSTRKDFYPIFDVDDITSQKPDSGLIDDIADSRD